MTIDFSIDRIRQIRQRPGQIHATLALPSELVKENRVRHAYKTWSVHDEDHQIVGKKRELVQDVYNGELRPAKLTVLMVELADVLATEPTDQCRILDIPAARACGFHTVADLREFWAECHPYSPLAKIIWFSLGDTRDHDRYLRRYIHRGGDYSSHRGDDTIDHLPSLTEEQLEELAGHARQRDTLRRVDSERALMEETLAERVERLEQAGAQIRREIKNEMRIITTRVVRGTRKLR